MLTPFLYTASVLVFQIQPFNVEVSGCQLLHHSGILSYDRHGTCSHHLRLEIHHLSGLFHIQKQRTISLLHKMIHQSCVLLLFPTYPITTKISISVDVMSQIFTSDFKWDVYKNNKNGRRKVPLGVVVLNIRQTISHTAVCQLDCDTWDPEMFTNISCRSLLIWLNCVKLDK